VVSRPAKPDAHRVIEMAQTAGRRVIADLDDNYFEIDDSNTFAHKWWTPKLLQGLTDGLAMADAVTVPSGGMTTALDLAIDDFPDDTVVVIPNGLHAQYLSYAREYDPETITLGWAGTQNTAAWLPQIADAVNATLQKYKNTEFLAVGVTMKELERAGIKPIPKRVYGVGNVNPHDMYMGAVSNFDIWLAPYQDTAFTRAKFPTKALEAGFLGIPLIASDVLPYREWMGKDGQVGFVVSQDYQWQRSIDALVDKPRIRQHQGENARAHATPNIMQQLGLDWCNVIEGNPT
jgi:glycosyltransferase involved in cell wall biosynthesis